MKLIPFLQDEWSAHYRSDFLREIMRLEGREAHAGEKDHQCKGWSGTQQCQASKEEGLALYRCTTCTGCPAMCKACIVERHMVSPFHFIEVCTLPSMISILSRTHDIALEEVERQVLRTNHPQEAWFAHSAGAPTRRGLPLAQAGF